MLYWIAGYLLSAALAWALAMGFERHMYETRFAIIAEDEAGQIRDWALAVLMAITGPIGVVGSVIFSLMGGCGIHLALTPYARR